MYRHYKISNDLYDDEINENRSDRHFLKKEKYKKNPYDYVIDEDEEFENQVAEAERECELEEEEDMDWNEKLGEPSEEAETDLSGEEDYDSNSPENVEDSEEDSEDSEDPDDDNDTDETADKETAEKAKELWSEEIESGDTIEEVIPFEIDNDCYFGAILKCTDEESGDEQYYISVKDCDTGEEQLPSDETDLVSDTHEEAEDILKNQIKDVLHATDIKNDVMIMEAFEISFEKNKKYILD